MGQQQWRCFGFYSSIIESKECDGTGSELWGTSIRKDLGWLVDSWVRRGWFSCEHHRKACYTYSSRCYLGVRPTWKDSPSYFQWKDDCSGFVPFEADWDGCIPDDVSTRWQQWLQTLLCLNDFVIRDAMSLKVLECCFPWSFIISLICVSLIMDAFLIWASQTSWSGALYLCLWQAMCCSVEANAFPLEWVGSWSTRSYR